LANTYSVALIATGGVAPYLWSTQDRLPAGITLSSSGVISGIPTGLGALSFAVRVTDSFTPQQDEVRIFTLTVTSALRMTTTTLPGGFLNRAYSHQLLAAGGTTPLTWVVTGGALPEGLTLGTNGLLQGTPLTVTFTSADITVTDARGSTFTRNFTLRIDPALPTLSAPALPANSNPAQHLPFRLSLAAPHPSPLSGQLALSFTSKAEIPADDPMTQFSTGTRSVTFTIPENTTDRRGVPRPQGRGYDVGAFEYDGAAQRARPIQPPTTGRTP